MHMCKCLYVQQQYTQNNRIGILITSSKTNPIVQHTVIPWIQSIHNVTLPIIAIYFYYFSNDSEVDEGNYFSHLSFVVSFIFCGLSFVNVVEYQLGVKSYSTNNFQMIKEWLEYKLCNSPDNLNKISHISCISLSIIQKCVTMQIQQPYKRFKRQKAEEMRSVFFSIYISTRCSTKFRIYIQN